MIMILLVIGELGSNILAWAMISIRYQMNNGV